MCCLLVGSHNSFRCGQDSVLFRWGVIPANTSTKANPIDPQDEEETKDDLEHVPIESNDHYDIDIAEDSMEEDQ